MITGWITPKNLAIIVGIILAFIGGRFSNTPESANDSTADVASKPSAKPRPTSRSRVKRPPRITTAGAGMEALKTGAQIRALYEQNGNRGLGMLQMALDKMNSKELGELAANLADEHTTHQNQAKWFESNQTFTRWAQIDPEAALRFAKSSDTPFHTTALQNVITSMAKTDPLYALEEAKKIKNPTLALQVKNQVMSAMATSDPDAWIAQLLSNPNSQLRTNHIGSYVGLWFKKDPVAAAARINGLPLEITRNSIAQISAAWAGEDLAAALQWAENLDSEQMKQQALSSAAGVIAKQDPGKAMELIENMPEGARHRALQNVFKAMAVTDPMGTFERALALAHAGDRHTALKSILNPYGNSYGSHRWSAHYYQGHQTPQYTMEQLQSMVSRLPEGQLRDAVYGKMAQHLTHSTPGQADEIIRSYPERARQHMAFMLIQRLSQTDPERALALHDRFPETHAQSRNYYPVLLGSLAKTNPEKALELALEDKVVSQRTSNINYVMSQISNQDPAKFAGLVASIEDDKLRAQAVSQVASHWGSSDSGAALTWAKSLPVDEQHKAIMAIIPRLAANDPHHAITEYEKLADSTGTDKNMQSTISSMARNIASSWASYNPEAASAWVSTLLDESAQYNAAGSIVTHWAQQDTKKAGEWVNSLPDGKARDEGIKSMVDHLTHKNPESAFDWAETISDESQKRYKLGSVIRQWKQYDLEKARAAVEAARLTDKEYEYLSKQLGP